MLRIIEKNRETIAKTSTDIETRTLQRLVLAELLIRPRD